MYVFAEMITKIKIILAQYAPILPLPWMGSRSKIQKNAIENQNTSKKYSLVCFGRHKYTRYSYIIIIIM